MGIRSEATKTVAATYTRPGNTDAYTAKDAIANSTTLQVPLTFSAIRHVAGGSGYVTKALLQTSKADCTSLLRLHLFNATVTAIADNAAYTALIANAASYLGYIDFPALATEGTGSDVAIAQNVSTLLAFAGGTTPDLFGLLETVDGFTPANSQTFRVDLSVENNGG